MFIKICLEAYFTHDFFIHIVTSDMKYVLITFIMLMLLSCSESEPDTRRCFSFDVRQCFGDPWGSMIDYNLLPEDQAAQFVAFFRSQGIMLTELRVQPSFHGAVCEACFVCPEGTRIFFRVQETEATKFESIDLLNFEEFACTEF